MGTGLLNPPSRGTCGLNTPKSTLDISHTRTRGAIFLVPARGKEEKPFDGLGLRDLPAGFLVRPPLSVELKTLPLVSKDPTISICISLNGAPTGSVLLLPL